MEPCRSWETGGLKDTVEAYNEYEHTGTGFSFANYNAHEMLGTIRYAISVFRDRKKDWNGLIQRGMKQDFSRIVLPVNMKHYTKNLPILNKVT